MGYRPEQTKEVQRLMNNIRAFRILDIKGNGLIIRNATNKESCATIDVPDTKKYEIGGYVDVIFSKTGTSSYRTEFLGKTPPEFAPKHEVEIF